MRKKDNAQHLIYIPFEPVKITFFDKVIKNLTLLRYCKDKSQQSKELINKFISNVKNINSISRNVQSHSLTIGGPNTFMKNLKRYMEEHKFSYITNPFKAKVIFCINLFDKEIFDYIKIKGGKVIQRLDGVMYYSKHGERYKELNRDIETLYRNYTDFIIFQSQHSREQCFSILGEKKNDEYTFITNGADKNIFYPSEKKVSNLNEKIKFVTTGSFRNIDMIEPVIKAFDKLKGKLDFEFLIIGPIVKYDLEIFFQRDYINHVITNNLLEIADLLRNSHIFIYSHLNPPCPNSLIEAISCGIPVVGFDSGSMSELLYFSKDLLAYVSEETFQKYEDFDYERLYEKILLCVDNYSIYQEKALTHSHLYSFEECGEKYLNVFKKFLEDESM